MIEQIQEKLQVARTMLMQIDGMLEKMVKDKALESAGWTTHDGGPMPVEKGILIDLIYRDGTTKYSQPAGEMWSQDWSHDMHSSDIVGYHVVKTETEGVSND